MKKTLMSVFAAGAIALSGAFGIGGTSAAAATLQDQADQLPDLICVISRKTGEISYCYWSDQPDPGHP